jgi:hypothetical protein
MSGYIPMCWVLDLDKRLEKAKLGATIEVDNQDQKALAEHAADLRGRGDLVFVIREEA